MYESTFEIKILPSLDDAVLEMSLGLKNRYTDFHSPRSLGRRLRRLGFPATDKDVEDSLIYHESSGRVRECEDCCGQYLTVPAGNLYLRRN